MYKTLPHYRVAFYQGLRDQLALEGVRLRLIIGQPDAEMAARNDTGALPWAERITNRYLRIGPRTLVWQPCLRSLRTADLVIVEQASKLLVNYPLLLWRRLRGPKLAWWGHGVNLDGDAASSFGEAVKRRLARRADWWFCYTNGTARIVREFGVEPDRMTVVQNALDVSELLALKSRTTESDLAATRAELGITSGPVAVAIGSIYPTKRPAFLLEAADLIRAALPDFHLLVIGDGVDRPLLDRAAESRPWLHMLGMQRGADLARYALLSDLTLNPGLVGLAVLDAFALDLPTITCDLPSHGPEIEYLEHAVNSVILPTAATPAEFAAEVVRLLQQPEELARLASACRISSGQYTVTKMTDNFAQGIMLALSAPRR